MFIEPLRTAVTTITATVLMTGCFAAAQAKPSAYQLADPIPLAGPGRWDYVTSDPANHLLYVPRTTHTQVIDTQTGKVVADVPGQKSNHGVALAPASGRGFITDGDGAVVVFDLKNFAVLGTIKVPEDADGILYDAGANKIIAVCGDASAAVIVDPAVDLGGEGKTGKVEATVDLGGKPESLAAGGDGKVYIDIEDKDEVAVLDVATKTVTARWPVAPGGAPVGLSIDAAHGRLFVGCRKPAKVIVLGTVDGKVIADLPLGKGCDAAAFDAGLAYLSCGDGTVTVVGDEAGKPLVVDTIKTATGARTIAVDTATHTLYLPTAEFGPTPPGKRWPSVKDGTVHVVVVKKK